MDEVSPFEPSVITAVRQHWRLVIVAVLVFTVPAGIYAATRPATYKATASLTVGDPRGPGVLAGQEKEPSERYVADQLPVFRSVSLGQRAAERGQKQARLSHSARWYLSRISATAAEDSNLLAVSFTGPTEAIAKAGLRATVFAYADVTKAAVAAQANEIRAQLDTSIRGVDVRISVLQGELARNPNSLSAAGQIQQLVTNRVSLVTRYDQVGGEAAVPASGISQALLPDDASTSGIGAVLRVIAMALLLGLLVGIALAYLRSYRKRIFMHARDPELVLNAPLLIDASSLHAVDLLGVSPDAGGPFAGQAAQDLFGIAASLLVDQRVDNDQRGLSLAVISAQNGASCTAVSWRVGLALAAQGLRVLLVDVENAWPAAGAWTARVTDRLPWVESADGTVVLGVPAPPSRRTGPFVGRSADITPSTGSRKPGLYVCSEAPPVSSQKELRAVFRDLEGDFDVVLVNAPPFLPSADAAHLASAAGSAMIVVPAGSSVTEHEELVRRLQLAAVKTVGYVYCCSDCDVPNPPPGTGDRLKRALHVERSGESPRKVSGLSEVQTPSRRPSRKS
jgi:Mrp family chromosome partitioning ATPase/capsular polysaccharide biosynthesis protein